MDVYAAHTPDSSRADLAVPGIVVGNGHARAAAEDALREPVGGVLGTGGDNGGTGDGGVGVTFRVLYNSFDLPERGVGKTDGVHGGG